MNFLEQHIREQYKLLGHEGMYTQCHAQNVNTGRMLDRRLVKGVAPLISWAKQWNGKGNLFVGRNPRNEKGEIEKVTSFSFDIDPIREKGEASTYEQLQEAIAAARKIWTHYKSGRIASSGNGVLITFSFKACEIADTKTFEEGCKRLEDEAREIIKSFKGVRLDSTFDVPRLVKLIGSLSTKGRPEQHRVARFLDVLGQQPAHCETILTRIQSLSELAPVAQLKPLEANVGIDRSKEDFAMVLRYHREGLTAAEAFSLLKKYSFKRTDDSYVRNTVLKVYGTNNQPVSNGPSSVVQQEPRSLEIYSAGDTVRDYLRELEERRNKPKAEFPFGLPTLDELTRGLKKGDLCVVGARTGVGKSSFLLTAVSNLSRSGSARILVFSTEMSRGDVRDRLASIETGIPSIDISSGRVADEGRLSSWISSFETRSLHICDDPNPSTALIRETVSRVRPDIIVFDHIQRVVTSPNAIHGEISKYVKELKNLCREFNCACLMASQLNRNAAFLAEQNGEPPSLRHLEGSGAIEQEASQVVLLYPAKQHQNSDEENRLIVADLQKNRFGKIGSCILTFRSSITKFEEI